MFKYKIQTLEITFLYLFFFEFFINSILRVDGNAVNFALQIPLVLLLFLYLLRYKYISFSKKRYFLNAVLLFVVLLLLLPPLQVSTIYIKLLIVKVVLLSIMLSKSKITLDDFTQFLNITYLIFVMFSVLLFFNLIPFYNYATINTFEIDLGPLVVNTIYGIGGSTADIDSYSGVIFLWNLSFNRKNRSLMMAISLFVLVWTLRGTPLVALFLTYIVYLIVYHRAIALLAILSLFFGLLSVVYILNYYPYDFVPYLGITWETLFWGITHSRSSLWSQQAEIYLFDYSWTDYIIGPHLKALGVHFITPEGIERHDTFNPHNSYLILIYRSMAVFIIAYVLFLYYYIHDFSKKTLPIVFYIMVASLTNSQIFGLENPIFLFVLIFVIIYQNRKKFGIKVKKNRKLKKVKLYVQKIKNK